CSLRGRVGFQRFRSGCTRKGRRESPPCPPLWQGKKESGGPPSVLASLRRRPDRPSVVAARGGWDRRLQGEVPRGGPWGLAGWRRLDPSQRGVVSQTGRSAPPRVEWLGSSPGRRRPQGPAVSERRADWSDARRDNGDEFFGSMKGTLTLTDRTVLRRVSL